AAGDELVVRLPQIDHVHVHRHCHHRRLLSGVEVCEAMVALLQGAPRQLLTRWAFSHIPRHHE
ncbi:MAG: hypothetical protein LC808_34465, partial [Actinobacteria bacterium]|nr:hypothetical protein [Actinomycetota bacterium]